MVYKLIEAKGDAAKLQDAVNELIQDGWQPLGGIPVVFSPNTGTWWFYQAMVKNPRMALPSDNEELAETNIASGRPKSSGRR
jgi:hypothetical protein